MARAGMTGWRGRHTPAAEGGDEVQKSLELLDQVLSEFDDLENGNVGATVVEAESPSLGHQSEDDGYMSMNGRRAKLLLDLPPAPEPSGVPPPLDMADFPPPPEEAQRIIANLLPRVAIGAVINGADHVGRLKGSAVIRTDTTDSGTVENGDSIATATQTTLPKTRHQRPYGWQDSPNRESPPFHLNAHCKYGSLPIDGMMHHARHPPLWNQRSGGLPPRTVPAVVDRHREVRRQRTGDEVHSTPPPPPTEDEATFSDDSLEGSEQGVVVESAQQAQLMQVAGDLTEQPRLRGSIAWEVPLGDDVMAPGSTLVVGRRRRSAERSSNGSLNCGREGEEWPEPPGSTEEESGSAISDPDAHFSSALPLDLTFNGTYVIRKGRKKERTPVHRPRNTPPRHGSLDNKSSNRSDPRTSITFDNIRLLVQEGRLEGLDDPPPDFLPPAPPPLVRVLSLPNLPSEKGDFREPSEVHVHRVERFSHELSTTVEEAEDELSSLDNPSLNYVEPEVEVTTKPKPNVNYVNLLPVCYDEKPLPKPPPEEDDDATTQGTPFKAAEVETQTDLSDLETQTELELVGKQLREINKTKSELEEVEKKIQEIVKIKTTLEREREKDLGGDPWIRAADLPTVGFPVQVQVHEFGPLPPSPVDEFDAYSQLYLPASASQPARSKADTLPDPLYRGEGVGEHRPPLPPPHGSLKSRAPEPPITNSLKTRSMDAGFARGPKAYCNGARREGSSERRTLPCELPGPGSRRRPMQKRPSTSPQESSQAQASCSLPETPIFARGCDIPRTPARSATAASAGSASYRQSTISSGTGTGSYRATPAGVPIAGAELLRLAGGPARGWYPRHRQPRPASSEHLDRLPLPPAWDTARKPMTLPPNITPKFFHKSPRDALRRVTSLLIRGKGSNSKDVKKDTMTATLPSEHTDTARQKRGFFRSLWKRSRHYSLDQQ